MTRPTGVMWVLVPAVGCWIGWLGADAVFWVWGPAQHSRVAPIDARIPSSNAGERGPRANAEFGKSAASF